MFKSFFAKSRSMKVGFTLIELLVVIAIIGVLASIVLASLNTARRKSRDARRISDVKQVQLALELFFDAQTAPQYPASTAPASTCTATLARGLEVLATNGFIPAIPRDPNATPNCYGYATAVAPALTYHIWATLEDTANPAFNSDKDCDSTDNVPVCTTGVTFQAGHGIDGAGAALYDLVP